MPTEDPASVLNEKWVEGEGIGCVFNRCLVFGPSGRGDAINGHMPQKQTDRQKQTNRQHAVRFFQPKLWILLLESVKNKTKHFINIVEHLDS